MDNNSCVDKRLSLHHLVKTRCYGRDSYKIITKDLITTICLYAYRFSDAPSYLVRHLPRSDHYYYIFSTLYEFQLTPVVSNSFLFHTLQKLISTDMLSLASDCNSLNTQLNLLSCMCCLGTFQFVFYKIAIFFRVTLQYDFRLRSINILSSAILLSCDFHRIQFSNKIPKWHVQQYEVIQRKKI